MDQKFSTTASTDRFGHGADSLLDLACGRGGDIWKWMDSKIGYVKGLDLSPGEIAEAKQRYKEALSRRPDAVTRCEFADTPNLGIQELREPRQYDIITCMFALHYFFVSEAALRQFLHNVSINLKDGGYFIGTVPDGKRVNEYAIRLGHRGIFSSPMLQIEAKWQGAPATFGSPYLCAIGDTVTGGDKNTSGSYEYLVYSNVLVAVAAQVGLKPVLRYEDDALEECFEPSDEKKPLKHFNPHFIGSDDSLEKASRLFTAFVFQKTHGNAVAPSSSADGGGASLGKEVPSNPPTRQKRKTQGDEIHQEEEATIEAASAASLPEDQDAEQCPPRDAAKAPSFKRPRRKLLSPSTAASPK